MKRRTFLKSAVSLGAAASMSRGGTVLGANDRLRVAVVGIRSRGGDHIAGFLNLASHNVEVAALCDIDETVLEKEKGDLEKKTGRKIQTYVDMRKLLENQEIDIISFATPNFWHALGAIWAIQAEKDVYLEKPCSHNIWEGRKIVEAARKYNRVVQHGTQIRSSAAIREAIRKLQEGVIGEVYMARGLCYKRRNTIGKTGEEPVPQGVHYDLWTGPAHARPFTRNRFHYNWHWQWEYGNGDIGNQGVHQMDIARWGLGVGLPKKVQSMGSHFMFDDDQETPNVQLATFFYPEEKKLLAFEVRHWDTNSDGDIQIGVLFYGSKGTLEIPSYSAYRVFLGPDREAGPAGNQEGDHFLNFIEAVRARDPKLLTAEIEEGHLSSSLCHLANISYRLEKTLTFDPKTETFPGDQEANALLTRNYRPPFVVPELV